MKQTATNNPILAAARRLVSGPLYASLLAADTDMARRQILRLHGFPTTLASLEALVTELPARAKHAAEFGARLPRGVVLVVA